MTANVETYTIRNPKNGESIESAFQTDPQAARALIARLDRLNPRNRAFAEDLIRAEERSTGSRPLSPSQSFWLHKLAMPEAARPAPEPAAIIPLAPLNALFSRVGQKLKRPAVVLALPSGGEMKVSLAGSSSRYPGQLMVASPEFGGAYYGRVDGEGRFFPGRSADAESLGLLERFAADPLKVAAEHGHLTGRCCFCNRALSDDKSTALGYGPVCAKKWNLEHSAAAARRA